MSAESIRPENIRVEDNPARVRMVQGDLTLRDYFAAKAMTEVSWTADPNQRDACAAACCAIADSMLKARTA